MAMGLAIALALMTPVAGGSAALADGTMAPETASTVPTMGDEDRFDVDLSVGRDCPKCWNPFPIGACVRAWPIRHACVWIGRESVMS